MIQVTVGTTTERKQKLYDPSTALRFILEDNAIDYSVASILLDGANIGASDMDKTLAQLNKTVKCVLIAVVKAQSARF